MKRTSVLLVAALCAGISPAAQGPAAEWPQYLGPSRNGAARGALPVAAKVTVAWRTAMPGGAAGIVVSGDRAYTLGSDGEQDFLLAIDTASGNEAWRLALGSTHADAAFGPGSTPALAGNLAVTVSTMCQVKAVDVQARTVVWTVDLGAQFKSRFAARGGCAMPPLVAGTRVVLPTGSPDGPRVAAFDAASGKLLWAAGNLLASNTNALGFTEADGKALVLYRHVRPPGISGITALDAATGAIAWQIDGTNGDSSAAPTAAGPGRVLLDTWRQVSVYDLATRAQIWTTRELAAQENPGVQHNGHLYAFGGQGGEFLTAVDMATGQIRWAERIYRGHVAVSGATLVVLSHTAGLLRLVAADPAGYRELARVPVLQAGARTGTAPTIAGGRIFVRNLDEIVAVAVQ